jgi:hypothetical protein
MPADNDKLKELLAGSADEPGENEGAPVGVGMTTPQENEGAQAEADTKVALALELLSQALPAYGAESDKGKPLMKSIESLQRAFGVKLDASRKLIPAELKMMMEAADMRTPEMMAAARPAGATPAAPMQLAA